jgi:VanZ family protein
MLRHRSSAWPLALVWLGLIVYASLHPFRGWIWPLDHGRTLLDVLLLPAPRSSSFDLWSNFLAYVPLGLLLALGWLRGGSSARSAWLRAVLCGVLLSLLMEWLQNLLPVRVPSRIDWATNSAGSLSGATLALLLRRFGLLEHWQLLRDAWFVPHGPVGLALLLAWPVAQLFPPPLPLGLGQGLGRLLAFLHEQAAGTPLAPWLPALVAADTRLSPGAELAAITLGLLAPCFVAFEMTRQLSRRLILMSGAIGFGLAATTLSTALNFGPDHALGWITPAVGPALLLSALLGGLLALLPHRSVAACGLVALTSLIALVNQAGMDPYSASSLQSWERGRFIRFHGLAQWLGWLWPFVALGFLLARLAEPPGAPTHRRPWRSLLQ